MTEISNEYATAVFQLALENGAEKEYAEALRIISNVLKSEPDYMEFLACPCIPATQRTLALQTAFSSLPEHIISFASILCEKGRIREFEECFQIYSKLLAQREKRCIAKITSATQLTSSEIKSLEESLGKNQNRVVTAECHVDSSVIGGLIIEIDGKIIDGSVRKKLSDLKEVITK